jgi:hypothetical protein
MFRIDAEMRCEFEKIRFVRKNEIEHSGEESGIRRSAADGIGADAALGEKAPKPRTVAGNECERLGGDGFRRILG